MKITFLEEADSEFSAAVPYYDGQEPGLGQRFEDEIDRALFWLVDHPSCLPIITWHLSSDEPRNLSVPYPLYYSRIDFAGCRSRDDDRNTGCRRTKGIG